MGRFRKVRLINWVVVLMGCFHIVAVADESPGDDPFQCIIANSKIVGSWISGGTPSTSDQPKQIIIEGMNFGSQPKVYLGTDTTPVDVVKVAKNNALDSVTINLPVGSEFGKYSIAIENTTGPFYKNNREINPIFCFGSIDFRVKTEM